MVAEKVTVYTRSYQPDEQGWIWTSDGQTGYEIEPAGELSRGTKIVLQLRDTEFARRLAHRADHQALLELRAVPDRAEWQRR